MGLEWFGGRLFDLWRHHVACRLSASHHVKRFYLRNPLIRGNPRFRQHKRVGSAGFVNPAGAVWGWSGLEEGCLVYARDYAEPTITFTIQSVEGIRCESSYWLVLIREYP